MRPLFVVLLLASACETTVISRFVPANPSQHARTAKAPAQVQVFTSAPPAVPYTELGVLEEQVHLYGEGDSLALVLAHFKSDGANLGCDAVVVGGSSEETMIKSSAGNGGFWGTCIVYNR